MKSNILLRISTFTFFSFCLVFGQQIIAQPILWGLAHQGGTNNQGTIYQYDATATTFTLQYNLGAGDAKWPKASFVQASNGFLYGTTEAGGVNAKGVIFKYDPVDLSYDKIHDFATATGATGRGSLLQADDGHLYGMASVGGANSKGVIFKIDISDDSYSVVHDFDGPNGWHPSGDLIQASDGLLYGMTGSGGSNSSGVIFSFDISTNILIKLHDFDGTNGSYPAGRLLEASNGLLYGITGSGGASSLGVIFKFDPTIPEYTKTYDFTGGPSSGEFSEGSLIEASDGLLYGMANEGGTAYAGLMFSYDTSDDSFNALVNFDYLNGASPRGDLLQAGDGLLYGLTEQLQYPYYGTIFSYDISTSIHTVLHEFDAADGAYPKGSLIEYIEPSACEDFIVNFTDSNGDPLQGGSLEYREGGGNPWVDATEISDGIFCIDTERSKVGLRMTYGPQVRKVGGVSTASEFTFQTVNVTIELKDAGTPVDNGEVDYTAYGWHNFGFTGDDGAGTGAVSKEMMPAQYTFRMKYNGDKENKTETISLTNNLITFELADLKSGEMIGADEFQLQSYPNPFSGNTTIAFSLEEAQEVNISVYDQTGRLIEILHDGIQSEGNHKISWDGNDVNKGVYFVRLSSAGKVVHQNIVKM